MENRMVQRRAKRHKRALRQKSLLIFLCLGLTFSPFSTLAEGNEEPEGDSEGTEETESQETENGEEEEVNGETLEEETQESEDVSEEGTEEEDTSENEENTTENSESEESVNEEETDSSDSSESTSNTSEEAVEEDSGNETDSGGAEEEGSEDVAPDKDESDNKQENASSENDEVTEENQVAGEAEKASDEELVGAASVESSEDENIELLADGDFEWEENADGTVTVTDYTGSDTDVTIPDQLDDKTVTVIGDNAFQSKGLVQVTLPDSLETIGVWAFQDNELEEIAIPVTVENINARAFDSNEITNVVLPDSVSDMGSFAFRNNQVSDITFGNGLTAIPRSAFENNALTDIDIPEGVTEIGLAAFGDNQISTLHLPDSLIEIGNRAFDGNDLTSISLPDQLVEIGDSAFRQNNIETLTTGSELDEIGTRAFQFNALTELNLAEGVTFIGNYAFEGNALTELTIPESLEVVNAGVFEGNNLTSVDFHDGLRIIGSSAFAGNQLSELIISEGLETINTGAFEDNQLTELIIPETTETVRNEAFRNNDLAEVTIENPFLDLGVDVFEGNQTDAVDLTIAGFDPSTAKTYADDYGHTFDALDVFGPEDDFLWEENSDGTVTITGYTGNYSAGNTDLSLPEEIEGKTVTDLGADSFENEGLTSVIIPGTVEVISQNAFRGNNLTSVEFAEGLAEIGQSAFFSNDIEEVDFPESLEEVGSSSFARNDLSSVSLGEQVSSIGFRAFFDNQIDRATIMNRDLDFGTNVFEDNQPDPADVIIEGYASSTAEGYADDFDHTFEAIQEFEWIDNSDGTVTITDYTGSGTDIVIPEQLDEKDVRVIDEDALRYKGLEEVSIPDTVEEIHDYAFAHNHLTSVDLPDSVVEIAYRAFYENKLTEIDFPNQITVFRNGAFSNNELESINLPDSLEELEVNVFRNNELTSVTVPEGVTHISSYAFADNQISDVTLPASLESIESNGSPAFLYNPVESIEVDDDNQQFKDINQAGLYTKDGTAIVMGTLSGEIDSEAEVIHSYAFAGLDDLTEITIPDTIKEIDFRAFTHSGLTTIDIPESVEEVGSWAFEDNDLTHVTVRNEQMDFGDDVFEENQTDAEDLVIEGFSSSTAETYADENGHTFSGTLDFQWTDNTNGTATITDYLGSAQEVTIPETIHGLTVSEIGMDAFSDQGLTSIELPETVTIIGLRAFEDNSIEEVTFSEGLTYLGPLAFSNNDITDLALPDSLDTIGYSAFINNGMTSVTFGENLSIINFSAFRTNDLTEVHFPEGLTDIGNDAFRDNDLTDIHLPDTIETLGDDVFRNSMLESVRVVNPEVSFGEDVFLDNQDDAADFTIEGFASSTSEAYADDFGHTFEAIPDFEWEERDDGTVRITGYNGLQTDITIPDELDGNTVTAVGERAFYEMDLTSVDIPDTVERIEERAFKHNSLTHVTLPEDLTHIDMRTFQANGMESVTFNENLTDIGYMAFYFNAIEEMDMPVSVQNISALAFKHNNLEEVTIPENTETVGFSAFAHNELAFVEILNQTTELEDQPFEENQSDPEELLIRGYDPSTAKEHAEDEGFSFDPINLMVVEIPDLDDADVVFGTPLADLPLPEEVDVELNNDEQQTVSVTWNEGEPVYDRESTGDYVFEGSLDLPDEIENPAMLSPSLTVTVSELTVYEVNELDSVSVDYGTSRSDLALPEEVDVELSDESTVELAVTWNDGDPAYDGTSPGSYAFTGTLDLPDGVVNPDDETAEMTIVVDPAEVTSVTEPAPVEVAFGTALADLPLPEDIEVTLNDGSTRNVSVAWDEGTPPYDEYYSGEYVFTGMLMPDVGVSGGVSAFNVMNLFDATGTIMNPEDLQPELTVTVEAPYVTDVADPETLNVGYGKALSDVPLPEDVEVTLNDGTTMDVPVSWEEGDPAYDGNTPGDYPFTGTPDVGASENDGNEVVLAENEALLDMITNPDDLTAELIVTVDEPMPVAVEQFETIEVPFGTPRSDLDLPEEGAVTFEDGSEKVYSIEWDESVPEYDEERFGSYAFYGELQGSEFEDYNEVHRMVIVLPPEDEEAPMPVAVEQFDPIEVPFGTLESELDLPAEGTVTYEDGSEDVFAIEWVESDPDYDGEHAGTYFFRGILQDGIGDEFSAVSIDVIVLEEEVDEDPAAPEEKGEEEEKEKEEEKEEEEREKTLPQTNQNVDVALYLAGVLLVLLAFLLTLRMRKMSNQ